MLMALYNLFVPLVPDGILIRPQMPCHSTTERDRLKFPCLDVDADVVGG